MRLFMKKTGKKRTKSREEVLKQRISVLETIALEVAQSLELDFVIKSAYEKVTELLEIDGGGIYVHNEDKNVVEMVVHKGLPVKFLEKVRKVPPDQFKKWGGQKIGDVKVTTYYDSAPAVQGTGGLGFYGVAIIPLKAKKNILGYLNVGYRKERAFSEDDIHFLSIVGNQIGTAIENARLYKEMKESEEKYRNLIENSQEGVIILRNNCLVFFNSGFIKLSGYSESELLKIDFPDIVTENQRQKFYDFQKSLTKKSSTQPAVIEITLITKNEKTIDAEITGASINYNSVLCHQYILRDVTEKKKLEDQLIRSEKLALAEQILTGIAHEIKNPLASMCLSAQNLTTYSRVNETAVAEIQNIMNAGQKINRHLEQFLNFARPEKPIFAPCNIHQLLDEAVSLVLPHIRETDVLLQKHYADNSPHVLLNAEQIVQVFVNILLNAVQAIEKQGKILIETRYIRKKQHINVEIKDTGKGMTPDVRKKIFDPFFSTKKKGTGMGLSVTAKILEKYGIDINVESNPGTGTLFSMFFPVSS